MSLSAVSESTPEARVSLRHELLGSLRENSPLILFTIIYALVPFVVARAFSIHAAPYDELWLGYAGFLGTAGVGIFAAFAIWYLHQARVRKVPGFQSIAWQRIRFDFLHRDRLILALPILLLWPITASAFSYIKSTISVIQPFYLDEALHQWDRALHFGIDPWRLLQPFVGYTWVTYVINVGYALWFFVFHAVLVLQACATANRKLRMQYLLTTALAWVLMGNLAATLMSSAGPCFYGYVAGGTDPYLPQMAYLRDVSANLSLGIFGYEIRLPFTALMLQDLLWQSRINGDFGIAMGISAAPSMHVASSWMICRLAWTMGRPARIFGSLFLLFVFVGSIHLGWHYAVDGYLGVAGAWILWRFTGWLLDRPVAQSWLWPDRIRGTSPAMD
jgi:hypothetical protein